MVRFSTLLKPHANLSRPTGMDEQELSISGAAHNAFEASYEETENQDLEIY